MFDDNESNSASALSTGVKVAVLAAIPFIALGVYFLIAPIAELRTTTGAVFGCGSALSAPSDKFASNICGDLNTMYMYRGIFSIIAGIGIAGLGFFLFGSNANAGSGAGSGSSTNYAEPAQEQSAKRARTFD